MAISRREISLGPQKEAAWVLAESMLAELATSSI